MKALVRLGAVWSGSALFAQIGLSLYLIFKVDELTFIRSFSCSTYFHKLFANLWASCSEHQEINKRIRGVIKPSGTHKL